MSLQPTITMLVAGLLAVVPSVVQGKAPDGVRPLLVVGREELLEALPKGTLLLHEPEAIEQFLETLDGAPPDWTAIYDAHGSGHDERLFALNRQRDGLRGNGLRKQQALAQQVTFFWSGELSDYDARSGGFRVAIGPKVIATQWGLVRFKPEGLPSELIAIPSPGLRESLRRKLAKGERIEVDLAISGRLVPDESIIYDFAHEEPGRGMVMPIVRVQRVDYLLAR